MPIRRAFSNLTTAARPWRWFATPRTESSDRRTRSRQETSTCGVAPARRRRSARRRLRRSDPLARRQGDRSRGVLPALCDPRSPHAATRRTRASPAVPRRTGSPRAGRIEHVSGERRFEPRNGSRSRERRLSERRVGREVDRIQNATTVRMPRPKYEERFGSDHRSTGCRGCRLCRGRSRRRLSRAQARCRSRLRPRPAPTRRQTRVKSASALASARLGLPTLFRAHAGTMASSFTSKTVLDRPGVFLREHARDRVRDRRALRRIERAALGGEKT